MPTQGSQRTVRLWNPTLQVDERGDHLLVSQAEMLNDYPQRMSDRIAHWANLAPNRTWMAERGPGGDWITISYGELHELTARVGGFLLGYQLSPDRPLLILSENSLEHAVLSLSAQYVGIPVAVVTPGIALHANHSKLRAIIAQMTPGMVFAGKLERFAPAILQAIRPDLPIVCVTGSLPGREIHHWHDVVAEPVSESAATANAATGPDTIAKFLFTSGTTGGPKAVIQTQRMLCSNMEMVRDCYRFFADAPPLLVDWTPWSHVAGGNNAFNTAIYNGGTFYIDGGRPTPLEIGETIRNLLEVSPTWYFNVPAGYRALCGAMEQDSRLAQAFFRRLDMMVYAGAGMDVGTWRCLSRLSEEAMGTSTLIGSGLGSTETAPCSLFSTEPQRGPGNVGIPGRGISLKLVPFGDAYEVRIMGPNVTPGYWRDPELTARAFDDDGYYIMGDTLKPQDYRDFNRGFVFNGRTSENFKLQTGTWVVTGVLRTSLIEAGAGLISDAVIVGENREELGALLVPNMAVLQTVSGEDPQTPLEVLCNHDEVRRQLKEVLTALAERATGSSSRIGRVLLITEPLDPSKGEITDKGSINQRAVLANHPELVERLYGDDPEVIITF